MHACEYVKESSFNIWIYASQFTQYVCMYVNLGMIGVPGIAHRLFGALKAANISVMFIAQASSEHSKLLAIHIHTFIHVYI